MDKKTEGENSEEKKSNSSVNMHDILKEEEGKGSQPGSDHTLYTPEGERIPSSPIHSDKSVNSAPLPILPDL